VNSSRDHILPTTYVYGEVTAQHSSEFLADNNVAHVKGRDLKAVCMGKLIHFS
jgi:hypothetical protein